MVWQIQWVPKLHSNLWACVDRQCWLLTVMIWVPTAPNLVDKMEAIVNLHTALVCCCWIEKVYIEQILAWGGPACDVRTSARSSSLQMRWWGSFYDNHFSLISRSSYARREGSSDEDTLILEVEPPTDRSDVRTLNNMFYKSSCALLHVWIALVDLHLRSTNKLNQYSHIYYGLTRASNAALALFLRHVLFGSD